MSWITSARILVTHSTQLKWRYMIKARILMIHFLYHIQRKVWHMNRKILWQMCFILNPFLCVCVCLHPLLFTSIGCMAQALNSKCKFNMQLLHTGWPFNHSISMKKSALIQTSSVQIPKAFHQHEIAEEKTNCLGINPFMWPIVYHTYCGNKYP